MPGKVSKIKLSNVEDKVKYVAERKVWIANRMNVIASTFIFLTEKCDWSKAVVHY